MITHEEVKKYIEDKISNAFGMRKLTLMFEAYGCICMANRAGLISREEYMTYNHRIMAEGINRPASYDDK